MTHASHFDECRQSLLIEKALLEIIESVRSQLKDHDRRTYKLTVEEGASPPDPSSPVASILSILLFINITSTLGLLSASQYIPYDRLRVRYDGLEVEAEGGATGRAGALEARSGRPVPRVSAVRLLPVPRALHPTQHRLARQVRH